MTPSSSRPVRGPSHQLGFCTDVARWFIDGAGDFDLPGRLEERQPDHMLNLGTIAGESPGDHPTLDPRARTEELPTSFGEPEFGWFHTHLKPGQWQCAEVVIEQLGTVGKCGISITDQPIEAGARSPVRAALIRASTVARTLLSREFEAPPILSRAAMESGRDSRSRAAEQRQRQRSQHQPVAERG